MISLHRLGHADASLVLNCDLVATVEANPDTVITLVTGDRLIVSESPQDVIDAVMRWRAEIGRQTFGVPKLVEPRGGETWDDSPVEPPSPAGTPPGDAPSGLRSV
ncbi:MAG: flagellar FlbD family protein [Solirubrobacteraceae bacterium]|nr:flagellar FlbD family protein [Solirubrobacteraceae bacterium]